jgi:hypothetical protein
VRLIDFGKGSYVDTANAIRELLDLPVLVMEEPKKSHRALSPETYLGFGRGRSYPPAITIQPDQIADYHYQGVLREDQAGLKVKWLVENERITAEGNASFLDFNFLAKRLYSVDTEWTRKIEKYSFFRLKRLIRRPTLKGFVLLRNRFYQRKSSIFLRFASQCLGLYLQAFEA